MPLVQAPFRPAWWLKNPHLQTMYPALLRKSPKLARQRERLDTPDGDVVDLDWYGRRRDAIVILLHGLAGSSDSGYIVGLQQALVGCGYGSVALNFRGCGGSPNRLARCYHAGDTADIDFVYQTLRRRYPQAALAAVGFSLGGNVLLKWLGEKGDSLALQAAVAVSVPLLLAECASKLDDGFSKVYRWYLLGELKRYMRRKRQYLESRGLAEEAEKLRALGDLSAIRSFWQYDDRVVARLHGFNDVHDYYRQSSSRRFLPAIRVPTLLLQAADDPFMTPAVLPARNELAPLTLLEVSQGGGHVGFVGGDSMPGGYWLERRIPAFLADALGKSGLNRPGR